MVRRYLYEHMHAFAHCSCLCLHQCGELLESVACSDSNCTDCVVSDWAEWALCDLECSVHGFTNRSRTVLQPSAGAAAACPATGQSRQCTEYDCSQPPTDLPTEVPSAFPESADPSSETPTFMPTTAPSPIPSALASMEPTVTLTPTEMPASLKPSAMPTETDSPTHAPSEVSLTAALYIHGPCSYGPV